MPVLVAEAPVRSKKFPNWLKKNICSGHGSADTSKLLESLGLHTICESGRCPNRNECYSGKTATFLILGNICTRSCGFCAVSYGMPQLPDPGEPERVRKAVVGLGLKHVVITSVTRDDLPDEGAEHFAAVIREIKKYSNGLTAEVLTPDFRRTQGEAVEEILAAGPDVYNHNIETVPAFYSKVRPQGDYRASLELLRLVKDKSLMLSAQTAHKVLTKSGLMLGLGETQGQVLEVLSDLRSSGCDLLTLGQYLKPSQDCLPVEEYITPKAFLEYKDAAIDMGFLGVQSGPFVRSSYHAIDFSTIQKRSNSN